MHFKIKDHTHGKIFGACGVCTDQLFYLQELDKGGNTRSLTLLTGIGPDSSFVIVEWRS